MLASNEQVWNDNIHTEVAYWQQIISGEYRNKDWVAAFKQRSSGQYPWPSHLTPYLEPGRTNLILDVGAGPSSTVGPIGAPEDFKLTAIDPLASEYDELLGRYDVTPWVRTQFGKAEELEAEGWRDFDLVYSRNALDHSYDPLRAISQMILACKVGGHVYFEGEVNEGVNEKYHGLHQWNFLPLENGDLVVWNKSTAQSLRSHLNNHEVEAIRNEGWCKVAIRRL